MNLDRQTVEAARDDVAVFAEALVNEPLWDHQLDAARPSARICCVCSGRQAGKTRLLAILALHDAFRAKKRRVLIVSAGEDAAKDLLAECSALAAAPILAGSVVDDQCMARCVHRLESACLRLRRRPGRSVPRPEAARCRRSSAG